MDKDNKEKHLTLKNIIKNLQKRNLITKDDSNVPQNLQKDLKELVKHQIRKQQCLPVSKTYNASVRQFALTLHIIHRGHIIMFVQNV